MLTCVRPLTVVRVQVFPCVCTALRIKYQKMLQIEVRDALRAARWTPPMRYGARVLSARVLAQRSNTAPVSDCCLSTFCVLCSNAQMYRDMHWTERYHNPGAYRLLVVDALSDSRSRSLSLGACREY